MRDARAGQRNNGVSVGSTDVPMKSFAKAAAVLIHQWLFGVPALTSDSSLTLGDDLFRMRGVDSPTLGT